MKKGKLLTVSLSLIMLLVGCDTNTSSSTSSTTSSSTPSSIATSSSSSSTSSTPISSVESSEQSSSSVSTDSTSISSDTTSSIESSIPVKDKAVISRVVNLVSEGTLNVKEGDKVDIDATITLTFETAISDATYEIAVNKTVSDMIWSEDKLSCSFTLSATKDEELTIGVIKKNQTSETGKVITFTQGEHYVIFGITSGNKYKAGYDYETWDMYSVCFGVIIDKGYVGTVQLKGEYDETITPKNGIYQIEDGSLEEDAQIVVEIEEAVEHAISYTGIDNIDLEKSVMPTTFTGGDSVAFSLIVKEGFAITAIEFSHSNYVKIADYSSFVLVLPNKDIQVHITTVKEVAIELESSEHLSNVGFYKTKDYVKNSENKWSFKLTDEITTCVPDSGSFFMAVNVESGYQIGSIEGASEAKLASGSKMNYNCEDGRLVYQITLKGDTKIKVNFVTQKTVSLDSSVDSEKVSLIFENDNTKFYPGDVVRFNTLLNDSTNTRIGKVSYCYTNESGELKEEVINAGWASSEYTYKFTMPNGDVKIKAEVIDIVKATVSYTNSASSNLISSIKFSGVTSSAKLTDETTTLDTFEESETVKIELGLGSDHSKKVKAVVTQKGAETGEEIELELNTSSKKYTGSFIVPKGGCSVSILDGEACTSRTITIPSTSTIEYYKSEDETSKIDSLGDLYDMDEFYFVVKDEVAEGKFLDVSATCGEEIVTLTTTTIGDEIAYKVTVSGDINISIKQVDGVKITFMYGGEVIDGTDYIWDYYTDDYVTISNGYIKKDTIFAINAYDDGIEVSSVTIDGEVVKGTYYNGYKAGWKATGEIVVNLVDCE